MNKSYRNKLTLFIYSQSKNLEIENIKKFPFYEIFLQVLDYIKKDHEFCSSLRQYNEFLSDNFTIMYILQNKIPYIIDYNRLAIQTISEFLEFTNPKSIVSTNYNDINGVGEMFEKIESSMKGGIILFIDNCEENIYQILDNLIVDNSTYNSEKGRFCYEIKDRKMDKNEKFKLYLIKSRTKSKMNEKCFSDCVVVNFNCPSDYIEKKILGNLVDEQDPITYQQIKKLRSNISKDEFKLLINENRIINFGKFVYELDDPSTDDVINRIKDSLISLGNKTSLSEMGVKKDDLDELIDNAMNGKILGKYKRLTKNDVKGIIYGCFDSE